MADTPVFSNILWSNRDEARHCPKADIKLGFCPRCSHVTNVAFDPSLLNYTYKYENTLEYSPKFQAYRQSIAESLVEQYQLFDKSIISIGCGKGAFLNTLCKLGRNHGVGFDPTVEDCDKVEALENNIELVQDYYSDQYANYQGDLIVCTHVLEHIFNPKDFLKMLRGMIDNRLNPVLFFEVPNAISIFRRFSIWDIIYEHYSYFTPTSLHRIFSSSGFRVCSLMEHFGGQFLSVTALPSDQLSLDNETGQEDKIRQVEHSVNEFMATYEKIVAAWKNRLRHLASEGQKVVVWGAGSKGVTFLNLLPDSGIEYIVDINPRKKGKFIAGTGQKIVPPDFLRSYKPNIVIAMNPLYEKEILRDLRRLGLSSSLESSLPSCSETIKLPRSGSIETLSSSQLPWKMRARHCYGAKDNKIY